MLVVSREAYFLSARYMVRSTKMLSAVHAVIPNGSCQKSIYILYARSFNRSSLTHEVRPNPSIERTFNSRPRYAVTLLSAPRGRLLNAAHVKR